MIVITAPTSAIGRQVLAQLVERGQPIRVIARDPARLPSGIRDRIEVVQGSHGDHNVADSAFKGAESVFWLVPPDPKAGNIKAAYLDFTRPAIVAMQAQGVKRVVGISALGRGTAQAARAGLVSASLEMDDMIAHSGVSYRALIMPSFMDNLLRQVASIANEGVFRLPIAGDLKSPTCATRDIAAAAVDLLLDKSWNGSGSAPVLGPEDLSFNEMAQILSEVLGKPVRYQQIPLDALKARFLANGMSEAMAQGYVDMMKAKNEGMDNAEPRTPEASTPTSFRQWSEEVLKPAVEKARTA